MKIMESFKNYYLTCGVTKDNFIFENCNSEFMQQAIMFLNKPSNNVMPCNIKLTQDHELLIEKTLNLFKEDLHKKFIARDFVCSLILLKTVEGEDSEKETLLKKGISYIFEQNLENIKKYHSICPMPHNITKNAKAHNIELNLFLENVTNKYLIQAINNFISSREPYSIKLFSNNKLSTYYDQLGNRIECPHDYMSINYQNFIELEKI